jgi:hypothetical protein
MCAMAEAPTLPLRAPVLRHFAGLVHYLRGATDRGESLQEVLHAFLALLAEVWRMRAKIRFLAERVKDLEAQVCDLEMPAAGGDDTRTIARLLTTIEEKADAIDEAEQRALHAELRANEAEGKLGPDAHPVTDAEREEWQRAIATAECQRLSAEAALRAAHDGATFYGDANVARAYFQNRHCLDYGAAWEAVAYLEQVGGPSAPRMVEALTALLGETPEERGERNAAVWKARADAADADRAVLVDALGRLVGKTMRGEDVAHATRVHEAANRGSLASFRAEQLAEEDDAAKPAPEEGRTYGERAAQASHTLLRVLKIAVEAARERMPHEDLAKDGELWDLCERTILAANQGKLDEIRAELSAADGGAS